MAIVSSKQQQEFNRSRGLGDTIAKMASAVGIKPCGGCKQRQDWLNRKLPYKTRVIDGTDQHRASE